MTYRNTMRWSFTALALFTVASVSALAADTEHSSSGVSVNCAINDGLFYSIDGGSVISLPLSRSNMSRQGLNGGWSSDLMCGSFDLKTTVGNQLNGITRGPDGQCYSRVHRRGDEHASDGYPVR